MFGLCKGNGSWSDEQVGYVGSCSVEERSVRQDYKCWLTYRRGKIGYLEGKCELTQVWKTILLQCNTLTRWLLNVSPAC